MKASFIGNIVSVWLQTRKQHREMRRMRKSFTIHEERNGFDVTLTLIRIIKEGDMPLDEASVKLAKEMYLFSAFPTRASHRDKITFSEEICEMTMEEINRSQRSWNEHCEMAWQSYD